MGVLISLCTKMKLLSSLVVFALAVACVTGKGVIRKPGMCVMYDICKDNGDLPCPSNTEAKALKQERSKAIIAEYCPHLSQEEKLCCSDDQVAALKSQTDRAKFILMACPHCNTNFRALFCDMVCSPNQSEFLDVTDTAESNGVEHVTRLSYYLSKGYATGMYESCKKFPMALCMKFFGKCTLEETYNFLGDNSFTTLKTDYYYKDATPAPFKPRPADTMIPCDRAGKGQCSCSHCEAACNE